MKKSKYRGVCHRKERKYNCEWFAAVWHEGKYHFNGHWGTEEAAAQAHDRLALKLKGDLAKLNFPKPCMICGKHCGGYFHGQMYPLCLACLKKCEEEKIFEGMVEEA